MARRDYEGGAKPTEITASINATALSIDIADSTGWPTGGGNGKFYITIDRGLSTEERVLVASRTGLTLTVANVGDRGVDGTTATSHSINASIEHTFSAVDADEANQHINDTGQDHHTQYMKADGTRHDLTARHGVGSVVPAGVPGSIQPDDAAVEGVATTAARSDHKHAIAAAIAVATGAVNTEGVATSFARSDHVHALGVASADGATLEVNAGAMRMKDAGITYPKFPATFRPLSSVPTASRPASPITGEVIYDTTLGKHLWWNGAAWRYLSGSVIAQTVYTNGVAEAVANGANYPAGLNVTFDALGGDVIVETDIFVQNTGGNDSLYGDLMEAAVVKYDGYYQKYFPSLAGGRIISRCELAPTSGSHTYNLKHTGANAVSLLPRRHSITVRAV